jgi:rare lipoprotein A
MRRVLSLGLALFFAASLGAAPVGISNSGSTRHQPKQQRPKPYQVGKASWYGKQFAGRDTASGEPFDMFRFTAAHRTLPLGTLVRVTDVKTGNWVIVRVNDRGPMVPGRIIDLSYGAAQMLGLRGHGITTVRLDLVSAEQGQMVAQNIGSASID